MTDYKKPGVAFWATVALVVVLVGYPLSFGPWCWAESRSALPMDGLFLAKLESPFYNPILWAWWHGPSPLRHSIRWFANLGAAHEVDAGSRTGEYHCVLWVYWD